MLQINQLWTLREGKKLVFNFRANLFVSNRKQESTRKNEVSIYIYRNMSSIVGALTIHIPVDIFERLLEVGINRKSCGFYIS